MAVAKTRPTTPARRHMTTQDFDQITTKKPVKSLIVIKKKTSGRNNAGRITSRFRGGGRKQFIRVVDFNPAAGQVATVEHIEYDPGRSARIARLRDTEGNLSYTIATSGMRQGQTVRVAGDEKVAIENGNRMKLGDISLGATINSIEITPGRGAQAVRAAGTGAQLVAKEGGYAMVRMPSGEVRRFNLESMATIGTVGNEAHQNIKKGSAGRNRHLGIRPHVRGVTMNASDHPHGGGDGGQHGTGKAPRTPWGQLTLGHKTRHRKSTDWLIVRSRHDAKRRK